MSGEMAGQASELEPDDIFYWDAFQKLSRDRHIGDLPGPIPWSSMKAYANDAGIEDADDFIAIICIVDDVFVKHHHEEFQRRMDEAKRKSGKRR